jgi:hypothetical protein
VPDTRGVAVTAGRRDLRARTRGAQVHSHSPVRPRIPRPPNSTARSPHCILKTGERTGANRSAQNSPLRAMFLPGQVIWADSTSPQLLYQAIGEGNLRAYVQGQDDVGHAALSN